MVSLSSLPTDDPIRLRGFVRSSKLDRDYPFELQVRQSDLVGVHLGQTGDAELAVRALDGSPSGYRLGAYSITNALNGQYVVHAGLARTPLGNEAEFVASCDPLPPVIAGALIVIGVLAGLCALITLTTAALEALVDLAAIAACFASGGFPTVTVNATPHFKWGPGWTDVSISCSFSTSVSCAKPASGIAVPPVAPAAPPSGNLPEPGPPK